MAKSLILYYSSTGYNRHVAQLVSQRINADVFEIKPVKPYSTDMNEAWEVAKKERADHKLPALSSGYPEMSEYQQVFLGGPSWGYTLANPIQTFLKQADFAGKKLYPWVTFYDHDDNYLADLQNQVHHANVQPLLELTMTTLNDEERLKSVIDKWLANID